MKQFYLENFDEYKKKEITKRHVTTCNTRIPQNAILTGKKALLLKTVN